jgi:predicted regulator of Ras-like GTPase activity (Roadblock/LC7/MglB family)
MLGTSDFPIKVGELGGADTAAKTTPGSIDSDAASASAATRPVLDAARGRQALSSLLKLDGLLGCALVDASSGLVLAHETRDPASLDMDLAAASCAQVLESHRNAALSMGLNDPIDEVITTAGSRHVLIRALQRHEGMVLVAVLEKHRTNLALARFQLLEVERSLP